LNDYYIPANLLPVNAENIDIPVEENVRESVDIDVSKFLKEKKTEIESKQTYDNYPQSATNNAKRMLEFREKYGRDVVQGGTDIGWRRASQLASRTALSLSTLKRVKSFLARHKDNSKISDEFKGEPYKDKGYVAYNLWGGESMRTWVNKFLDKLES